MTWKHAPVNEHLLVVRVRLRPCPEILDGLDDRAPVPQADVRKGGADREVAAQVVECVAGGVPRKAVDVERGLVELVVGGEDQALVEDGAVDKEELLRQEREGLGVPAVGVAVRIPRSAGV